MLGMKGERQNISIGSGCEYKGIILHEILHALGRIHEHTREDRDSYVEINAENIKKGNKNTCISINIQILVCPNVGRQKNFLKMEADTGDLSYDYDSIMHYNAFEFSISSNDNYPTITPIDTDLYRIGQRNSLSNMDWEHIKKAYCSSI